MPPFDYRVGFVLIVALTAVLVTDGSCHLPFEPINIKGMIVDRY